MNPILSCKRDCSRIPETDFSKCVFCQSTSTERLNNLTKKGVITFVNAIKSLEDDVIFKRLSTYSMEDSVIDLLDEENTGTFLNLNPRYHASCRNFYIYQKKGTKQPKLDKSELKVGSSRQGRSQTLDLKLNCFLCEKQRDSKGKWATCLVATKDRQEQIHRKAKELQGEVILTKIEGHGW